MTLNGAAIKEYNTMREGVSNTSLILPERKHLPALRAGVFFYAPGASVLVGHDRTTIHFAGTMPTGGVSGAYDVQTDSNKVLYFDSMESLQTSVQR